MKNIKLNMKKLAAMSGLSIVLLTTSACSEKAKCDVEGKHLHKYQDDYGYVVYIDSEDIQYREYTRTDEYIVPTFMQERNLGIQKTSRLLRVKDNADIINNKLESYNEYDHIEYEYTFNTYLTPKFKDNIYYRIPIDNKAWTIDPNHDNLTGKTRLCHYTLKTLDIYKQSDVVKGPVLDKIDENVGDLIYFMKSDMIGAVDKDNNWIDAETDLSKLKDLKEKYPESFIEPSQSIKLGK